MAIFNEAFLDRYQNEVINENFIKKIIEKIKNRHDHSDEVVFSSSQYSVYRKAIIEISKKYEHVGKYLYVLTYKDICQVGCDSESDNDFEYWVAAFDTDDRRDDKEIIAYEKGYGNRDFVRNLDKECEAFVKELNSANINGAKFDSDFDGHRFDLKMFVVKSLYVKESTDETIEEGFGRRGFRDVKPLRDDKDGNKDDDKFTTRPDGSKWQNSIDLPDDNGGWVDSIKLDEAVHTYSGYPYAGKHFKGVAVEYYANDGVTEITKEQKERFNADFAVVKAAYNKLFKEKFIPWLTNPYKDEKEKSDCVKSLDLYNVTYYARKDNVGEIEFQYTVKDPGNPSNEPVAFCIHVKGKEIIKAYGYDI